MSRRPPNPAAEKAAQNQQALKTLVKLETNKSCADCKKNKHPRWASWNLGIFICIRCSGIHRGMGTHISRVKSVDLDAWTDEQLQSMLRWGNSRANKYWEAKLAPGHVPAEAKIENFIRTKYDSKRWVMDGPMPDPTTLDNVGEAEDSPDLAQVPTSPLRSNSQRASSTSKPLPQPDRQQPVDLFGDEPAAIPRPSTTEPVTSRNLPPPKSNNFAPRPNKPGESLLGMDFFGSPQSAPPTRQANATPPGSVGSRPDLKQSILSLYASAPKPAAQNVKHAPEAGSFGVTQASQGSGFSGLDDAFSGLTFTSSQTQSTPVNQAIVTNVTSTAAPNTTAKTAGPNLSGGSFFDPKPASKSVQPPTSPSSRPPHRRASSGFGDFESAISPAAPAPSQISSVVSPNNDLFALSSPPLPVSNPTSTSIPQPDLAKPTVELKSVFNLSAPAPAPQPKSAVVTQPNTANAKGNGISMNMDPWGSSDVWGSSNNAAPSSPPVSQIQSAATGPANLSGWNAAAGSMKTSAPPKITEDEDFGGWSSNVPPVSPAATSAANPPKPSGGFGGGDDLFSNVWE